MNKKTKFFIRCLCAAFVLMVTVAYAEETGQTLDESELLKIFDTAITAYYVEDEEEEEQNNYVIRESTINDNENQEVTTTTDIIEYDVVYTVTTVDGVTSLNTTFTVINSESRNESPLLMVAIYNGVQMVNMEMSQPTVIPGMTVNETVSIVIPEDKNENYYIKLFAWEGMGSLRPLGKYKMVNDIDSYLREKLIYITAMENSEFKIFMNASTAKGGDCDVIHTIKYDTTKVVPIDLCGFTYEKELSTVEIPNLNIVIESVDSENGIIKYKFLNDSGRNTGINNIIKFKALTSIIDEEIKYTIQ